MDARTIHRRDRGNIDVVEEALNVFPSIHHALEDVIGRQISGWLGVETPGIPDHPLVAGAGDDQHLVVGIVAHVLPHPLPCVMCSGCVPVGPLSVWRRSSMMPSWRSILKKSAYRFE